MEVERNKKGQRGSIRPDPVVGQRRVQEERDVDENRRSKKIFLKEECRCTEEAGWNGAKHTLFCHVLGVPVSQ